MEIYNGSRDVVKNNQNYSFINNNLAKLASITFYKTRISDYELANKKDVDDSLVGNNIVSFNQTLENSLKPSI